MPLHKTVKKVLLGFTILCALLLAIFSVELILLNRDTGAERPGPTLPAGTQNGDGESDPGASDNGAETPDNGDAPENGGGQAVVRPPTGTRFERLVTVGTLVFHVDEAFFTRSNPEMEDTLDIFTYIGEGTAAIEIRMISTPQGARVFAERFLESTFGVEDPDVGSEDFIGLSQLRGVMATGERGGITYEAWVHNFTEPGIEDLGLVFVISYQNITQREALRSILDTLSIVLD